MAGSNTEYLFGIGAFWATRTDVSGKGPQQFAVLQDNSIDFGYEVKELYSQLGFPVDIARGKGKVSGKTKTARVFGSLYAEIFFGVDSTVGGQEVAENEPGTIPGTSPYQLTVVNAVNFVYDLGVYFGQGATNQGARLVYANTPAAEGQYTVNPATGVYTFDSADSGQPVLISYVWAETTGVEIPITNQFMGFTPTFQGTFYTERSTLGSGGRLVLTLYQCTSSTLNFPSKIDDYNMVGIDYQAFANSANNIGLLSTTY